VAVESLPLPMLASMKAVPALPRLSAERSRAAIAIAAASVFISGVGSVYISAQAHSLSSAPSPSAAAAPIAVPAEAVTVAAPARDAGPTRRWGPGSAVDISEESFGVQRTTTSITEKSTNRPSAGANASVSASSASSESSSTSSLASSKASSSSAGSSSASSSYVVQEGDDFGSVAARFGISSTRIASLNPGVDSTQLTIGQSLTVG
jgi:LysM repeat protein